MRELLTGRGGAWCLLCNINRDQAAAMSEKDFDRLFNFEWGITHSYEQAQKIWDTHKVEDTCSTSFIRKKKGD